MSRSIEPSHEVHATADEAAVTGVAAVEAQEPEVAAGEDAAPRTLYDMIKHRVGNFSSGYTDLAERHSEYFTEGLLEKRRMGTL
jgi:hypothetical protein